MKRIGSVILLVFVVSTGIARAGQINASAFTSAATTQTFEAMGESFGDLTTPLTIGNDTYDADDHLLESSEKSSFIMGRPSAGTAIGNDPEVSTAPTGFIDITLGTPALRAGMYVGFEFTWTASAQFYNTDDVLIGAIALSGNGRQSRFAAWQADSGLIGRIRVETVNHSNRLAIDDVIQEVAEPVTVSITSIGILPFVLSRRLRRISCL